MNIMQWTPGFTWDFKTPLAIAHMPFSDYAAIPALNGSLAKQALQSPQKAAWYKTASKPRTTPLLFGTAWHAAMLEPETLPQVAVRAGDGKSVYSTRSTGKGAKEWVAQNPSQVAVDDEDFATLEGMVNRLTTDGYNIGGGAWHSEIVLLWECEGIPHKARLDGFRWQGGLAILEAKTARSADYRKFQRQVVDLAYFVSAAHYRAGVVAVFGDRPEFHFLAQEKAAPFDWLFVQASEALLAAGDVQMALVRQMWKRTDGFANPNKVQVVVPEVLELPPWYTGELCIYDEEQ